MSRECKGDIVIPKRYHGNGITPIIPHALSSCHTLTHEVIIMDSERYLTGQRMLQQVDGKGGDAVVDSLKDIAPDFAQYLIEFPFGDIYSRPGLDLRSREIATVAALTAMGNAAPQLKVCLLYTSPSPRDTR